VSGKAPGVSSLPRPNIHRRLLTRRTGDGSKEWTPEWLQKLGHRFGDDGAFWISYEDLLRKYQAFDRTRLFGPEWKITSIWTTLTVPWTLDYHDTHFAFTLAKPGPVVIVLSQLDDRYFRGLEGQYQFDLAFRLHKADQEDYVVRSSQGYRQNRSVNVELELEEGEYTVLVKIDAMRNDKIMSIDEVIKNNAKVRREKLIRIGLAYDLAHSKGKIIETAEEKARRKSYEQGKREKDRAEIKKKILEERDRAHYMKVKATKKRLKRQAKYNAKRKAQAEKRRQVAPHMRSAFGRPGGPSPPQPGQRAPRETRSPKAEPTENGVGIEPNGAENTSSDVPDKHVTIQLPEAETDGKGTKECDSSTDQGDKTPSSAGSDKSAALAQEATDGESKLASEENGSDTPKASATPTEETAQDSATETEAASETAEGRTTDEATGTKRAGDIAVTAKPAEETEKSRANEDKPKAKSAEDKEPDISPKGSPKTSPADQPSEEPAEEGPARRHRRHRKFNRVYGAMPRMRDPDETEDTRSFASDVAASDMVAYESLSESDVGSISSLSEISDREMDIRIDMREVRVGGMRPQPMQQMPSLIDDPDEFERDPWNAVAVVGLRIYYKVSEADKANEIVKLRVVRPYLLDEEEDTAVKKDQEGDTKAMGLDVDDSAKDATLEGDPAARKKSIVPVNDG
jgi:hypothetical protein